MDFSQVWLRFQILSVCNTTTVWQRGFVGEKRKAKTFLKLSVMVDLEIGF